MARKKYNDGINRDVLDQVIKERGLRTALDFENFAGELKKALAERMLNAEMDVHLGDEAEQAAGNHRNGTSPKTVDTGSERVILDIPRDRHGRFDPALIGNAGSFFKNPVVSPEQCRDIIGRDPEVVHYPLPDGSCKLAAGWLIDACGWKGKSVGRAGVYERQALVLVNRGGASAADVVTLLNRARLAAWQALGVALTPEILFVGDWVEAPLAELARSETGQSEISAEVTE